MSEKIITVDARGLPCPAPVLKTKKALGTIIEGQVAVLVDELVSKENVTRFAVHEGCSCRCEADGGGWRITIHKSQDT